MIGIYPFMNYPGVVMAHSELPGNQWSFLTPEGVFERDRTLARWNEFVAGWKDLPGGGCAYEAISGNGRGVLRYKFGMIPDGDSVQLELEITNLGNDPWRDVFVDMCLMHIRAPQFYDPDYSRTYIAANAGGEPVCVGERARRPQRPLFIRAGREVANMHFYAPPKNTFWHWSDTRAAGDRIETRSADGQWSIRFSWEDVQMLGCNWDLEHGCVHADPFLGDIHGSQSRRMRGAIEFVRKI